MFEKILTEKSSVDIVQGRWDIREEWSEYNQCGSLGRNDSIKRQDAVRLLGEMNLKLVGIFEKSKEKNPQLSEMLLQSTAVLSYAMWGLKELEPTSTTDDEKTTDCVVNIVQEFAQKE